MNEPRSEAERIAQGRVVDSLQWVAQEAKALKMAGVQLPRSSRLREALDQLDKAYSGLDSAR